VVAQHLQASNRGAELKAKSGRKWCDKGLALRRLSDGGLASVLPAKVNEA
jgi:hypothetical protein